MKTILEVVKLSTEYLKNKKIDQPKLQAEEIIADALGLTRMQLFLEHDRPLNEDELSRCRSFLTRRGEGEPSAYIRGYVDFYDCKIKVTRDVLIPRQETEILVDKIAQTLSKEDIQGKILWDVCCGSGCIGIALKKKFPKLSVICSDIMPSALEVVRSNAAENQAEVNVLQGDLLSPFQGQKAHYIVCNPPYISEEEYTKLDREVKDYEPKSALVGGRDGLAFYRRLQHELPSRLHPQGKVWLEIGYNQGRAVLDLFKGAPWQNCQLAQDFAGHDRFISLEIE